MENHIPIEIWQICKRKRRQKIQQLCARTTFCLCVYVRHIGIFCFNLLFPLSTLDERAPWMAEASNVPSVSRGYRELSGEGQDGGSLYELRERTDMRGTKLSPVIFH